METSQQTDLDLLVSVQESLAEARVGGGLLQGRGMSAAVHAWDFLKEVTITPSGRACREKVAQEALRPLETAETGRWRGGGQNRKHQPGGSFRSSPVSLGWTCGTGSHPGAVTGQGAPETLWFWLSEGNKRNGEGWLCLLVWGPWAVPPLAGLQSRQWGSQAPFQG